MSFVYNSSHYNELYLAEAHPRLIGRYCIVTGLGLTKDTLGGQVAWIWPGFLKAWMYTLTLAVVAKFDVKLF